MTSEDEPEIKRRRLNAKSPPEAYEIRASPPLEATAPLDIIPTIEAKTPRIGKKVFDVGDQVFKQVQNMFPNIEVVSVESSKGVDRRRGPPVPLSKGRAPLRIMFGRRRDNLQYHTDPEWESWEKLSKRQLHRNGTPYRIAVTVYGKAKHEHPPCDQEPPAKRNKSESSIPSESSTPTPVETPMQPTVEGIPHVEMEKQSSPEPPVQHSIPKHGSKFLAIPEHTRNQLLKVHLGHPDTHQYQQALRRAGWPDDVIKAIPDMCCDTCFEHQTPKKARPGHLRPPREFNDLVTFDGAEWQDEKGRKYAFFHFVDSATNFQVAAPAHQFDTESFIQVFRVHGSDGLGLPKR